MDYHKFMELVQEEIIFLQQQDKKSEQQNKTIETLYSIQNYLMSKITETDSSNNQDQKKQTKKTGLHIFQKLLSLKKYQSLLKTYDNTTITELDTYFFGFQ